MNRFRSRNLIVYDIFAYSRIVFFGSETASPSGLVEKLTPESKHVTRDRKKEIYTASRQTAVELWADVYRFLCRKEADYTYWEEGYSNPDKIRNFKMRHIT